MALYQHLLFNHGFFSEFIKPFEMKVTRTMFSLGFLFDARSPTWARATGAYIIIGVVRFCTNLDDEWF